MYENFIPELWSKELMVDRPKETVFVKLCYRGPFIGNIEDMGDRVKIAGIGRPTIQTYDKGDTLTLEYLTDNVQEMVIDQANYFDFAIDDIDEKQAAGKIESMQLTEARRALAETADAYIAGLYGSACTTVTNTAVTSANIISTIASGYTQLMKNNVPSTEEVALAVSPEVAEKIVLAEIVKDTDNTDKILGFLGTLKRFLNCTVYVSNNIQKTSTAFNCMMFTKKAIAFAEQIVKVEKFRPQNTFADAVKGLHLFGAKVIKPKELVTLTLTPGTETGV
jgi:guanylate kinase